MSRAAQKRNPGRGSQRLHRALGGTRILLAAAPTAPPCFCRWQRSSLLLFESTRPISLALLQNKNLSVLAYAEAFWWARVDYASRAAKNLSLIHISASAAPAMIRPKSVLFSACSFAMPSEMVRLLVLDSMINCLK